jgi:hypothetical protein
MAQEEAREGWRLRHPVPAAASREHGDCQVAAVAGGSRSRSTDQAGEAWSKESNRMPGSCYPENPTRLPGPCAPVFFALSKVLAKAK